MSVTTRELILQAQKGNIQAIKELNNIDESGRNALMQASALGKIDQVKELLSIGGIDVNQRNKEGEFALLLAAKNNHSEVIKALLLDAHIDTNLRDAQNKTAYTVAIENDHEQLADLLAINQEKILDKFIQYIELQRKIKGDTIYQLEDVEKLFMGFKKGQCNGLSIFWLYNKRKNKPQQFFDNIRLILNWDGREATLNEGNGFLKNIFEQELNDIGWLQLENFSTLLGDEIMQADLSAAFEFIKNMKSKKRMPEKENLLREEFSLSYILYDDELLESLKTVLNEGKMIYLGGTQHAIAAMKKNGKLYVYDSMDPKGEKEFSDLMALKDYVKEALFPYQTHLLPISIHVFDFSNKEKFPYERNGAQLVSEFIRKSSNAERVLKYSFEYYKPLPKWTITNALFFALDSNNSEMVKAILAEKEVNLNSLSENSFTPLMVAVELNNVEIATLIANDERVSQEDCLAAYFLANKDNKDLLAALEKALIKKGVNLNEPWIQAMNAIRFSELKELRKILENGYVNLNEIPLTQITALTLAAMSGNTAIIKLIIPYVNDINHSDIRNQTALMWAAYAGRVEIVNQLLNYGKLDVNLKNDKGNSALMFAIMGGNARVVEILSEFASVDVNVQNNYLETPLMISTENNRVDIVKILLKNKNNNIKLNLVDSEGNTAIIQAVQNSNSSIVHELVQAGGDVNIQNKYGWTALMYACRYNEIDSVRALIQSKDINFTIANEDNENALIIAAKTGRFEIVKILLEQQKLSKSEYENLMFIAAGSGNMELVRYLAGFIELDLDNLSPSVQFMLYAAQGAAENLINVIQEHGDNIDINKQDMNGNTAMIWADKNRKMNCIERIKLLETERLESQRQMDNQYRFESEKKTLYEPEEFPNPLLFSKKEKSLKVKPPSISGEDSEPPKLK